MLAWSSLATGYFAGRETAAGPARRTARAATARGGWRRGSARPPARRARVRLHQPDYVLPVVGTRSEAHVDDAFAAADLALTPEQVSWLEAVP